MSFFFFVNIIPGIVTPEPAPSIPVPAVKITFHIALDVYNDLFQMKIKFSALIGTTIAIFA